MTSVLTIIFLVLYAYTIITTISVLLLENRNPVKSLSWVLVLLFLPLLGLIFYLIFGQEYQRHKLISKKSIRRLSSYPVKVRDLEKEFSAFLTPQQIKVIKLLNKNNEAAIFENNRIEILADGAGTFKSMFDAIKNATQHIHIEFFIFEDDRISNELKDLLIQKAQQGIRVRMIYDYLGSYVLSKKYLSDLKKAGVFAKPYLPLRLRIGRSKINYRNHRKILIIDGKIGFTGGINVADRYIYGNKLGVWRDTFVRFEGEAVHGLQIQFLIDWYFVERKLINDKKYFPDAHFYQTNLVQIVSSGPDTDWQSILQGITLAIISASKYVYIHTPYFVPPETILNALQTAALSGVDVRLMIPAKSDSKLSDACSWSYLGQILDAGVKVYVYNKGFLHSKAIVVDDKISIVGSANMDERSFSTNFEVNAFIYDELTSKKLKNLFLKDVRICEKLSSEEWLNRKRWQKLKESGARLFSPLV